MGVVNSLNEPQDVVISGNNDLKLNFTAGSSLLTDTGFVDNNGLSLNQNRFTIYKKRSKYSLFF